MPVVKVKISKLVFDGLAFPSCKNLLNKKTKLKTDTDFVQKLLEQSNVAVVQGSAFGLPDILEYLTLLQWKI